MEYNPDLGIPNNWFIFGNVTVTSNPMTVILNGIPSPKLFLRLSVGP